jgi:hypothetical protein
MLGEHTEQVLSEWLGLSARAVAALKAEDALGFAEAPRDPADRDADDVENIPDAAARDQSRHGLSLLL